MAPPVGYVKQPSLADQIRDMVRSERLAMEMAEAGVETFEEADDFDVGDDYDPNTPYEETFDSEGRSSFTPIAEVNRQEEEANNKRKSSTPKPSSERSETPHQAAPVAPGAQEPAKPAGDQISSEERPSK